MCLLYMKKELVGVFPSAKMSRFIDFDGLMKERPAKHPFLILNTDRAGTTGTHLWEILDIHSKIEIFFFILLKLVVLKTSQHKAIKK